MWLVDRKERERKMRAEHNETIIFIVVNPFTNLCELSSNINIDLHLASRSYKDKCR